MLREAAGKHILSIRCMHTHFSALLPDSIYCPKFIKIKTTHPDNPSFLPPLIQLNGSQNLLIINSILWFQNYHLTSKAPHNSFKTLTAYQNYLMVVSYTGCILPVHQYTPQRRNLCLQKSSRITYQHSH